MLLEIFQRWHISLFGENLHISQSVCQNFIEDSNKVCYSVIIENM